MADPLKKAVLTKINTALSEQGKLHLPANTYLEHSISLFGKKTVLPASRTIAGRLAKPGMYQPKSTIEVVGTAPDGFGKNVVWDTNDPELALVVFLNAGDSTGVMISGAKPTDTLDVVAATGIASFSENTENEGVSSIIGIVAAGLNLTAGVFGIPEVGPLIGAAAKYAQEQYQERKVHTKRRDPFGVDPDTGDPARQEGGVLISLPEAGGIYYSGNSDHKERWIKEPGTRDRAHNPNHVQHAFFLQPGRYNNKRTTYADGDFFITPWDHVFEDNFGYYRLHILLKRGNGVIPNPEP